MFSANMLIKISCLTITGLLYASLVFSQEIIQRTLISAQHSDVIEFDFPLDSLNAVSSIDAINWGGAVYDDVTNKLYSVDRYAQKGVMIDLASQKVQLFGKGEGRGPEEVVLVNSIQVYNEYIVLGDVQARISHIYNKETLKFVRTLTDKKIDPYFQILQETVISASPMLNPFFNKFDLEGNLIESYGSLDNFSGGILNFTGFLSSYNTKEYYLNFFPAYLRYEDGIDELQLHILPSSNNYETERLLEANFKTNEYKAPSDRVFMLLYQDKEIKALIHGIFEDNYTKVDYYLDVYSANDSYLCSIDYRELLDSFNFGVEANGQTLVDNSTKFRTPHHFSIQTPDSKIKIVNLVDVIKKHIDKGK